MHALSRDMKLGRDNRVWEFEKENCILSHLFHWGKIVLKLNETP